MDSRGRSEMEDEGTVLELDATPEHVDNVDELPLSVEINWTASRLPSLVIEPAVSRHKFTFTTSFSIGPMFPSPDGDEIADLFSHEFTIVGGGQINDETVLVATSPTSDVRIAIDGRAVDILVAASSFALARNIGLALKAQFPKVEKRPDVLLVRTWYAGFQGVTSSYSDLILPSWDEIASNYPEPTRTQLNELMALGPPSNDSLEGKLILFHGAPGCGKTFAIRALLRSWCEWCAPELLIDPESAFGETRYLIQLLRSTAHQEPGSAERFWRVLVAEDADKYLGADARATDNPALDRLLNVSDGLIGQGSRLLYLLTTNSELAVLHPALVRPGRNLGVVEFRKFTADEGHRWLGADGPVPKGEMSLAELFATRNGRFNGTVDHKLMGQYL
jgi:ATPase family associated with various cellular activities (AAA)